MSAFPQPVCPIGFIDTDGGPRFRLGPIEILVKEDGSGTRGNLSVGEFRGYSFKIPPHTHKRVMARYGLVPVAPPTLVPRK